MAKTYLSTDIHIYTSVNRLQVVSSVADIGDGGANQLQTIEVSNGFNVEIGHKKKPSNKENWLSER